MTEPDNHSTTTAASRTALHVSAMLVLLSLIVAPWAMGGIPIWSKRVLEGITGIAVLLWLAGCLLGGKRPRVPWTCGLAVGWLLLQGWWMTLNAQTAYLPQLDAFAPAAPLLAAAPGSVDATTSASLMLRLTPLLGVFLIAADLGRQPRWRKAVWVTMAMTGASIAAFGLLQRAGVTDLALRQMTDKGLPYATFNYHANAGAYLNLTLPVAFGLGMVAAIRGRRWPAAGWFGAFALIAAANFVNLSRGAALVTALLVLLLGAWATWRAMSRRRRPPAAGITAALLAAMLLVTPAFAAPGESILQRWRELPGEISVNNGRLHLARLALQRAEDAPLFGQGPGTYKLLMPGMLDPKTSMRKHWVKIHVPGEQVRISSHAHNDYAQALAEWGVLGTAAWAVLVVGAFVAICRGYRRLPSPANISGERATLVCLAAALLGVYVHALFDFPLQIASLQLYAAVLLGLAWGAPGWQQAE